MFLSQRLAFRHVRVGLSKSSTNETRDGASRRLLSVSRSKAQNAIEASIETAIPINVDPSVSVWVWESFVAVRRSDVEAQGSPIGCRTECGSTRGRTKETKSTPQTWPQKPTPAAQRSSMISSATGFSGTTVWTESMIVRERTLGSIDPRHSSRM